MHPLSPNPSPARGEGRGELKPKTGRQQFAVFLPSPHAGEGPGERGSKSSTDSNKWDRKLIKTSKFRQPIAMLH